MNIHTTPLSIVFAGTPAFAIPCLDALHNEGHLIRGVYTQPDRPKGRGRQLSASAIKIHAESLNLAIYQPIHFKDPIAIAELTELKPDLMVVIAYGLILPQTVLKIPRLGCINVHASLLPRWRGASPIHQAILHGEAETGITIMQMDEGMDTGAMLKQEQLNLSADETIQSLESKLATLAPKLLLATLKDIQHGTIHPQVQDPSLATHAPKIKKEDARINWQESAVMIHRKIRAYELWPVTFSQIGDLSIKILQAKLIKKPGSAPPGTIQSIDKNGILIATGEGSLLIERLQFPSSNVILAKQLSPIQRDWLLKHERFS